MTNSKMGFGAKIKESIRKFFVSLKRRPHNIVFFMLLVCFVEYSLKLGDLSKTTAQINGINMGLFEFVTMLVSVLAIVCFINAFPKRQKARVAMIVLLVVMMLIMILCDVSYLKIVDNKIAEDETFKYDFVMRARSLVFAHIVLLSVTLLLLATLPVYSKLLKKINTSIELEYTDAQDTVELAEE